MINQRASSYTTVQNNGSSRISKLIVSINNKARPVLTRIGTCADPNMTLLQVFNRLTISGGQGKVV